MDREPPVPARLYTEEYFRTACEGYDEFNASEGEALSRRLRAAFELAEVRPGMRVLDVGCGRGEILLHCAQLGAHACGVDYAPAALQLARRAVTTRELPAPGRVTLGQANARRLPFADAAFDRVLLFDVVEHLHPWELQAALLEARRVLRPAGRLIVHTAPNLWYDRYAYPLVRLARRLMGQGAHYPQNPRHFLVDANAHVHVNEQSLLSLQRALRRAGFRGRVWLDSPPQNRDEALPLALLRRLAFGVPPFRWFFERELFAVAARAHSLRNASAVASRPRRQAG